MATPLPPAGLRPSDQQPLADAIAELAEIPVPARLEERLTEIARLAVQRVEAADYASVTTLSGGEYTTVAATGGVAEALDTVQIADGTGPCLQALETGEPVTVRDAATTMQWPGFHAVAPRLGLQASVSIPLHTGRGTPVAVLNLYGRDGEAMQPLIAGVALLYAASRELTLTLDQPVPDPGAAELLTGYSRALASRATIQLALQLLAARAGGSTDDAYAELCEQAGRAASSLIDAAAEVIAAEL